MQQRPFTSGLKAGVPIGLGYFAVSFSLGITAKKAGLTIFQGFAASLLTNASAGEYAVFSLIAEAAPYLLVALMSVIVNARYFLMSCALAQRIRSDEKWINRLGIGMYVTDEIFGVTIARPGYVNASFVYGCAVVASPCWALGTALGIAAGNVLPLRAVSALSVALYGMFLAVIVPPSRKNKAVLAAVAVSFALSYAMARLPVVREWSGGNRTILLTILIAAAAALIRPVDDDKEEQHA